MIWMVSDLLGIVLSFFSFSRAARVILTAVDSMAQPVLGEEVTTKDIRVSPYCWGESHRFGRGAMGLEVLAGIRIQVSQGLGRILGEGMLPLDAVFTRMDADGYCRQVVKLKNDQGGGGTLFLTMKGLNAQDMAASLQDRPLEDIAVSRQIQKPETPDKESLLQKVGRIGRQIAELPSRHNEFEEPRRGRQEEELPPRRGPPQEERKPSRGLPSLPPRPPYPMPQGPPPPESKAKLAVSGFLTKIGFGRKGPQPETAPPSHPEYQEPGDRRSRFEEDKYEPPRGRRSRYEEEFEEEEDLPRRRRRYEEEFEEEEDLPRRRHGYEEEEEPPRRREAPSRAKKTKKAKPQIEAISSEEFTESEPEVPEGKPTPFHTGKRIPYIPPPVKDPSGNPFARSCGNPFEFVSTKPPVPRPSPRPGAAFDLFAEPPAEVEQEEDLPAEPAKKPVPRPGYNPFAARQEGDYGDISKLSRRPSPIPGYNPFAMKKLKPLVINGKQRPNPFNQIICKCYGVCLIESTFPCFHCFGNVNMNERKQTIHKADIHAMCIAKDNRLVLGDDNGLITVKHQSCF